MPTVAAKRLRVPAELAKVTCDKPGWYRWWAPRSALKKLLGAQYRAILPKLTKGCGNLKGHRYVYVGVAIKESIRARLNWHVNQKHSFGCIKHGTLSTLRQSISSLVGSSQGDEAATNRIIDQLTVEFFPVNSPIRSIEAKTLTERLERGEMQLHSLPLNIQHNHNPHVAEFKVHLKAARKEAKNMYLNSGAI